MKIREGFVSNSSSSSFICVYRKTHETTLRRVEDLKNWMDAQNNDVEAIRCTGGKGEEKEWFYSKASMAFNPDFINYGNDWILLKLVINAGTCGRKGFYDRLKELQEKCQFKVILSSDDGSLLGL